MGKLNQGGTNVRGGSPKPRAPHTLPKSASARRQATPPTGKGSSVQSAKPTSGSEPPAPTTATVSKGGVSGMVGPSGAPQGFTVDPKHKAPGAQSPAAAPVPDMGSDARLSTAAGQIGAVPQPPNPLPNSPRQSGPKGTS